MTISSSLNAGVTGLNVNASKLATIADNIANSKTYGHKRADVDFSSLALTSREGSYTAGGVRASAFRQVSSSGSLASTTNPLDIAVSGAGMLPVTTVSAVDNNSGTLPLQMVTTGSFQPDSDGLVRTASGLALLGWPADLNGDIAPQPRDSVTGLEPVTVLFNQFAANRTTDIVMGANLPATATQAGSSGAPYQIDIEYYDNLGAPQNLEAVFTPSVPGAGSSNLWNLVLNDSDSGGATVAEFDIQFDASAGTGGSILSVTPVSGGTYTAGTGILDINVNAGPIAIEIGSPGTSSHLTQLSGSFSPTGVSRNGSQTGSLTGVEIDENGMMIALYDSGYSRVIYQIPLAAVANPNGLEWKDNQSFGITPDSGPFYLWDAGDGPTGTTTGYAREESTTDIAGELTQLIQTQRAYSSNAKIIQTVDEMLQETTNIKR
jgi:flagellar hook protein FlgE